MWAPSRIGRRPRRLCSEAPRLEGAHGLLLPLTAAALLGAVPTSPGTCGRCWRRRLHRHGPDDATARRGCGWIVRRAMEAARARACSSERPPRVSCASARSAAAARADAPSKGAADGRGASAARLLDRGRSSAGGALGLCRRVGPRSRPRGCMGSMRSSWRLSGGVAMAPEADPATLLRRVTLDLAGLPPTVEEVRASSPTSGPRLRARGRPPAGPPHYGERMAAAVLDTALRRHERLLDRRRAPHVGLAGLGHRRLQPEPALRPLRGGAAAGTSADADERTRIASSSTATT